MFLRLKQGGSVGFAVYILQRGVHTELNKWTGDIIVDKEKIDRINFLAKKAKEAGLSPEETDERDRLRREYIDAYKNNLRIHLDSITVVEQDGSRHKLKKKSDK